MLSRVRYFATPQTTAPPGPSVHGILQARTLEWVAISFSIRNYRKKESEVAQLCPTLCNPMDCSPPGSFVHGILQARTLEWVAISFSIRNHRKKESEVAQSCPTLCNLRDCSPPGPSVHGILQARILEWVANVRSTLLTNVKYIIIIKKKVNYSYYAIQIRPPELIYLISVSSCPLSNISSLHLLSSPTILLFSCMSSCC